MTSDGYDLGHESRVLSLYVSRSLPEAEFKKVNLMNFASCLCTDVDFLTSSISKYVP